MFLMLVGSDLIHFSPRVCLTYQHAGRVPAHHLGPHLCLLHDGGEFLGVQQQQALERIVQSRDQLDILCFGRYFRDGDFYSGADILSRWPLDIQNVFSLIVQCSNVFCRLPSEPHMHVALSH